MSSARLLLFSMRNWWHSISGMQQLLWSLALVSTFLSLLFLILYFTGLGQDEEAAKAEQTRPTRWTLLGITAGSWSGVLSGWITGSGLEQLLIAIGVGITAVGVRWWMWRKERINRAQFQLELTLAKTGRVLKSIPPHQAGFGTVRLNLRSAPTELNAVTLGSQIQPGQRIRVVEVMDGELIRVEPVSPEKKSDDFLVHGRGE